MTSRERLLAVMAGRPTDRVPISTYEMSGWDPSSWYNQRESYRSLMDLARERTDCLYMAGLPGPDFGHAPDRYEWHERRDADKVFITSTWHTPKGDLIARFRRDDSVHTQWTLEHRLKNLDDIDKYLSMGWEIKNTPDLSDFARAQRDLGDHGIMMPSLGDPICEGADLFEMGEFLIYALTDLDRIRYFLDAIHERQMAWLSAAMEAGVRAGVNWREVMFRICGPEYATPPYASPELFAVLVTPYLKQMSDLLHRYGANVRIHSHGKIAKVLDEIMKTNPDGLDPIEPPPDGDIELDEVKRRIGDRVTLYGNIELKLLEHGKIDQVRDFVIRTMAQAKKGGRFVSMSTASPINDPLSPQTLDNYRVWIDTAREHGVY